jgi:hypothetical protein
LSFSEPRLVIGKVVMGILSPAKAKPPPDNWRRCICGLEFNAIAREP